MVFWLLGCAHVFPGPVGALVDLEPPGAHAARPVGDVPSSRPSDRAKGDPRARTVAAAEGFLGRSRLEVAGTVYRFDCSGLVEAALASAGVPRSGSTAMLFAAARDAGVLHRRHVPQPGDVAFFDDTYDRDGDGRLDDPLSHSAVVETVAADGTVTLIHVGSAGVVRFRMNLRHPEEARAEDGTVWNDPLRARRPGDPRRTRYLAGELWVGFASFWRLPPSPAAVSTR